MGTETVVFVLNNLA